MRCHEALPLIEKLADREATAAEKRQAETHLEGCNDCQAHYRFLTALPRAARSSALPEPPGMYWEVLPGKVMERIERERQATANQSWVSWVFRPSRLRWVGAVAAAVVAVVVGLEVSHLRDAERSAAPVARSTGEAEPEALPGTLPEILKDAPTSVPADASEPTKPAEYTDEDALMETVARRTEPASPRALAPESAPKVVPGVVEDAVEEKPAGRKAKSAFNRAAPEQEVEQAQEGQPAGVGIAGAPSPARGIAPSASSREGSKASKKAPEGRVVGGSLEKQQAVGERADLPALAQARRSDKGDEGRGEAEESPPPTTEADEGAFEAKTRAVSALRDEVAAPREPAAQEPSMVRGRVLLEPGKSELVGRDSYLALLERYPLRAPDDKTGTARSKEKADEPSVSELQAECAAWRDFLESYPHSVSVVDARYRLARCSVRLFDHHPSEERRRRALEDGSAYLEVAADEAQAEEIRRALDRLRN